MCGGGGGGIGLGGGSGLGIPGMDQVTHAVTNMVGSAITLGKNLVVPQVPNPGSPEGAGAPPAPAGQTLGTSAPSQEAQRPSNSAGATQAGSAGSTLLTGGQGVAPSMLTLGRNTLLGQ
jgi:hypothetical protein